MALQESSEDLQQEDITRQFHVAHVCGCATLFDKPTLEPGIEVKSIYALADNAYCARWAFEAVLSRSRFRRIPDMAKSSFTMMSLHCQNAVAKKHIIA